MTGQAKAGDVGDGVHAGQCGQFRARRVELGGGGDHALVARGVELFLLERGRQDAHAERFAQHQAVAHAGIGIALHAAGVHQPQRHQAVNGLHRVDGVAPGNGNARGLAHGSSAFEDAADGLDRQHVDGHTHNGQRQDGRAAHGVHIRDGVGGGDAAKVERVVHNGHEKVGGGDQRLLIVQAVHGRVVSGLNTHQQLGRHGHAGGGLEDLREHARRDLAAAAAAMRQGGEARLRGYGCIHSRAFGER